MGARDRNGAEPEQPNERAARRVPGAGRTAARRRGPELPSPDSPPIRELASRPVSRVLSPSPLPALSRRAPGRRRTVIHLGRRLPGASSGLTRGTGSEQLLDAETSGPCSALLRAGFTWPAGHPAAGGPLPHHFTVAPIARGCVISVALSFGSPRLGVTQRPCSAEPGLSSNGRRRPRPSWPACPAILSAFPRVKLAGDDNRVRAFQGYF
jgi:hypothetical protein